MLEEITRFFTGYVEFEAEGDTARFMNIVSKSGYTLWAFRKKGDILAARTKASKYKKLRAVKQRTGVKLRCVKKSGLPFYLHAAGKRKGLFIGAAVFVLLYSFFAGGVWDIQVSGNQDITDARVLSAAREIGIYSGMRQSSINAPQASLQLARKLEYVSWISVNTMGSRVVIELKEAEKKPDIITDETACNLVAERGGQIVSVEAEAGMQQVKIGDVVNKGDLLIAGAYSEKETPYVEKKAPIKYYTVPARGSIRAVTAREFTVEVPILKDIEAETGRKTNSYLIFFGVKIPLSFAESPKGTYHEYDSRDMARLLGRELPVGIERETYIHYVTEERELKEEEWRDEALYQLRGKQNAALKEDSKIIDEKLEYEFINNICVLTSRCTVEEEIGLRQELYTDSFTKLLNGD